MPSENSKRFGVWENPNSIEGLEEIAPLDKSFSSLVVVDNIPAQVPFEKSEKLQGVISKIFSALAGPIHKISLPKDEKNNTKGYAFIEFNSPSDAELAVEKGEGYSLDKNHFFKVTSWNDFQKFLSTPETYIEPEIPQFETRPNLRSWMLDDRGIDQYVIRYGDITEVLWNDIKPSFGENQEALVTRENWTQMYVSWSPHGSYLATFHEEGIALWGGPSWTKLTRLEHAGVKLIDFSPCENYLITASPQYQEKDNVKDPKCIIIWDVLTGFKLKGFLGNDKAPWPTFKWSHDDKYVARMSEDLILVYETPSMNLLEPIKVVGLTDFCWSPSENVISYFVPEINNNKPASVVLLEIPSKAIRSQKNLFKVGDCKMHWHLSGDFLCVKVDRLSKKKKSAYTDFAFFLLREKETPVEMLEIKEQIIAFSWEPKGNKFAIVHGETPKPDVSFYVMDTKIRLLKTLEKKSVNHLFWSPQGQFIVLAGLGNLNGIFEFYNANDLESMGVEEHFNASMVEWDPTGRYVATYVTYWKHQVENGYNLYSFQGKLLKHVLKEKFYLLLWRPRPPSILPTERLEAIKKNIKEKAKQLKSEDKKKRAMEIAKQRAKRNEMIKEFYKIKQQKIEKYESQSEMRRDLRMGEPSDNESDYEIREQLVEVVEEVREEVVALQ